jgi:hypothetical protein
MPSKRFASKALNQTAAWAAGFHNPQPWSGGSGGGGILPIPLPLKFPVAGKG